MNFRKVFCYMSMIVFILLLFFTIITWIFFQTTTSNSVYSKAFDNKILLTSIRKKINGATGLYRLYKVDKRLYAVASSVVYKHIGSVIIKNTIKQWTDFLTGKSTSFNPILDLSKVRRNIYGILYAAIKRDKRIPAFLKGQAFAFLNKEFRKVPVRLHLLKLAGISKKNTELLNKNARKYTTAYSLRWLLILSVIFTFLIVLMLSKDRHKHIYFVSFIGMVINGALLLFILFFQSRLVAFAMNLLSYTGFSYKEVRVMVSTMSIHLLDNIKIVGIILIPFFLTPLIGAVLKPERIFKK